jgi:hypothetical protein
MTVFQTPITYIASHNNGIISKSLPIKTGFPSQSMQQLANLDQNDRPMLSHINPKDTRPTNSKGFPIFNNQSIEK